MLAALACGCALLAAAGSNLGLAAALLAVGVLLAPTTIVGSALLDVVAPAGTVTEAFTVMIMGIVAGNAAGNALGGAIVDGPGYETAALASAAIAAAGAATVYARRASLGTRSASTARSS
jgi:predicted MFS family arabinose efflux permease